MAQQPFSIRCGTRQPVPVNCPPNGSNAPDADGLAVATVYGFTQTLSPCKSPVVTSLTPPAYPADWNPAARPNIPGSAFDAAHPPIVSPGSLPLPPHCGWEGGSDFKRTTVYDFSGTIAEIAATANLFPFITAITITCEYDQRTQRTMQERRVRYTRASTFVGFDFTSNSGDNCSTLSTLDVTAHQKITVLKTDTSGGFSIGSLPTDAWNSVDLSIVNPSGSAFTAVTTTEHQDSTYFDRTVSNGQNPGTWGSFAEFRPDAFTLDAVYQFGRETVTNSNIVFTINVSWLQYHCTPDTGGHPPCKCNQDCPPCQGSNPPVKSGRCATLCADGGTSPTLQQGWSITGKGGASVADSQNPNGWSVGRNSPCTLTICAPCYTLNDYLGPFTVTWGTSDVCTCPGQQTQYKVFGATFSVQVDVVCPEPPPPIPKLGRGISYDVSEDNRHARAYVANQTPGESGRVVIGLASNVFPLAWSDRNSSVNAIDVSLRWDRMSLGSTLYLLMRSGSSIVLVSSADEGKTFQLVATLGTGSHPSLVCARDGRKLCYWFSNHAIVGAFVDTAGNIEEPLFTAIPQVDDDDIAHDESVDVEMTWRVTLIYRDGGQIKTKSSTDGKIFT